MAKRKNRHLIILKEVVPKLEMNGWKVTQFHHFRKMPKSLVGIPDLFIMRRGVGIWMEIKPRYANYMRDQMSDVQWQWFHDRVEDWGEFLRYAIVEDSATILGLAITFTDWWMPEYHWDRYETWRKGR